MSPEQVIDEVRDEWWAAEQYQLFIGLRCPECGRRACKDDACLTVVRSAVAATMTSREVAAVLGVGPVTARG